MASRLMYGMANEGVVPRVLGRVHEGRRTPWVAIIFTASIAAVLVSSATSTTLADTTVLLLLLVFIGVHICAAQAAQRARRPRALQGLDAAAVARRSPPARAWPSSRSSTIRSSSCGPAA